MSAGKGDKSRVRDLRKWQANFEAIKWTKKPKTKRKAKNAKS